MIRKFFVAIILIFSIAHAEAQIFNAGIKAGINYGSNGDLKSDLNNIKISSSNGTGFNVGVFAEMKLPLFLYIRPELVYTHTKSIYKFEGQSSDLTIDKIDAPLLVGIRFLKVGRIYLGPSFQYIINTNLSASDAFDEIHEVSSSDFSVGANFGVGIELGKFGVDLRWERGLSDTETKYVSSFIDENNINVSIDTRPEQFILGLYYKFK